MKRGIVGAAELPKNGSERARASTKKTVAQGKGRPASSRFAFSCSVQEVGQPEPAKRSTTSSDGRVRRNTLSNLGRSSRGAQFSQGAGQQERDGSHTRSG